LNAKRQALRFMLDEGVPDSVGEIFEKAGHEVIYLNKSQVIMRGSPDPLVVQAAVANEAILVALDGDMRKIAQGHGVGKNRYRMLSLIKLSCFEPDAAGRVKSMMSLIEHEWDAGATDSGRRLHIEILDTVVRSMR